MKAGLLVSASIIVLSLCAPVRAASAPGPHQLPKGFWRSPTPTLLYSQNSNDAGISIPSYNFTSSSSARSARSARSVIGPGNYSSSSVFDSAGADDFVVPAGHKWKIREVDVPGEYAPPSGELVTVYENKSGLPDQFTGMGCFVNGQSVQGELIMRVPHYCWKHGFRGGAKGKTYWLSVVAYTSGRWNWEVRNGALGHNAAWENPGGGFHTHCTNYWKHLKPCWPTAAGDDFMFALKGIDVVTSGLK
jgi:hypothetical protein